MPNTSFMFLEVPEAAPIPGKTTRKVVDESFEPETVKLSGGVLVKVKAVSLDPYMRGRMRDPSIGSYAAAYEPGKPVQGFAVGEVVRSEHSNTPVGTILYGFFDFSEVSRYSRAGIWARAWLTISATLAVRRLLARVHCAP